MQRIRALAALSLLVPTAFALANAGAAAEASVVTEIDLVGRVLIVRDVGDLQHDLDIRRSGGKVVVTDTGPLAHSSGCTVSGNQATCDGVGTTIQSIHVTTGTRNDTITVDAPGLRVAVTAGDGDDHVTVLNSTETTLGGGPGRDVVRGGSGSDRFLIESYIDGADQLTGGPGTDWVDYSTRPAGGVTITADGVADDGQTSLRGGKEGDNVGADIEVLIGTERGDQLAGSAVNNTIMALGGDDHIDGGGGNDTLHPGAGPDLLRGGSGNDYVEHGGVVHDGADSFDGGEGTDTVSYRFLVANVILTLDGKADDGPAGEGDNNIAVENAIGTEFTDRLTGNAGNNVLTGGGAVDYLHGLAGNDSLRGDQGNDQLFGEDGNDALIGGFGLDLLNAGNGNDSLDGGYENDVMLGLAGNDTMHAGLGGGGKSTDDDLIDGGKDYDLVSYNGRKGTVTVDADNVADDGHVEEKDNVRGSVENIAGGNGNDLLTGNAAPNLLLGQAGNDTLRVRGDGTLKNTTDGGLGRDVCQVDTGDTRKNCEA